MNRQCCSIRSLRNPRVFDLIAWPTPLGHRVFSFPHNQSWFTLEMLSAFQPRGGIKKWLASTMGENLMTEPDPAAREAGRCSLRQDGHVLQQKFYGSGNKLYSRKGRRKEWSLGYIASATKQKSSQHIIILSSR